MEANKQLSCKICSKVMESGNLSRRMKIHVNPSLKDSKQLCKDIKSNKDETSMYMEKPKVNDLHSDGLNILEDVMDDISNKDEKSMYIEKPTFKWIR